MEPGTAWEKAAAAHGSTPSERVLAQLAKKAFLSLWSYSNVFTDEGRRGGKGDGKELCDLLVVFGDDVLLFSDKHCEFPTHPDIKVSWPRWYKRAIDKSVRQLIGAEKFARDFPRRIFVDRQCQTPLPVPLPNPAAARYHLIAVTRGAYEAGTRFFGGGSSGSLLIETRLQGQEHLEHPFRIGFPAPGRFVHVWDGATLAVLLEELDTVPDLVAYLVAKEAFLQQPGVLLTVAGEEELLVRYMTTPLRDGQHVFPEIPTGVDYAAFPEGDWKVYSVSPQRAAKKQADAQSYAWDDLIEYQSEFIRAGTATSPFGAPADEVDHERIVRAMAQQPRLARRTLAADLHYVLSRNAPGQMFARVQMSGSPPSHAFVFLSMPRRPELSYEDYRKDRIAVLTVYCNALKEGVRTLREAVGIASEPLASEFSSQDFLWSDLSEMTAEEMQHWRESADEMGILRGETQLRMSRGRDVEFPFPFGRPAFYADPSMRGGTMNRAERRRMEREARKQAKRGGRRR